MLSFLRSTTIYFILLLSFLFPSAAQVTIVPENPSGLYKLGDTAAWTVIKDDTANVENVQYSIKLGGLTVMDDGDINFVDNQAQLKYTFVQPGAVLVEVSWGKEKSRKNRAIGGAIGDPKGIEQLSDRPEDFDGFWDDQIAKLQDIPKETELEPVDVGELSIEYFKIQMNNINGSHIYGQLAKPKNGEKLPALLLVQWAGIYPLQKSWVVNRAKEGWLVLNIIAHDLPIDEEQEFYEAKANGELKNYWTIGNDDRETSYFLRMYLSCYRAAQYLTERPEWNGKTLVVTGDSQGGQQAVVTAAIHPEISAAMALVPAGFDMLGPLVGRKGGWPHWFNWTEGKDEEKVLETCKYFDVANFIPRIDCPMLIGIGLLDETCPPESIFSGINQLKPRVEILVLPESGHQDRNGSQQYYRDRRDKIWLPRLKRNKRAPVNKKR